MTEKLSYAFFCRSCQKNFSSTIDSMVTVCPSCGSTYTIIADDHSNECTISSRISPIEKTNWFILIITDNVIKEISGFTEKKAKELCDHFLTMNILHKRYLKE